MKKIISAVLLTATLSSTAVNCAYAESENFIRVKTFDDGIKYGAYYSENCARIANKDDGKIGYIDLMGNAVTPIMYNEAYFFNEGKAIVGTYDEDQNIEFGFIDKSGNYTKFAADKDRYYKDRYYIDSASDYDEVNDSVFSNGLALLSFDYDFCGICDTTGNPIEIYKEYNGKTYALSWDRVVDGKMLLRPAMDDGLVTTACAECYSGGLYTDLDLNPILELPDNWGYAQPFDGNRTIAHDDDSKWHIIDENGNSVSQGYEDFWSTGKYSNDYKLFGYSNDILCATKDYFNVWSDEPDNRKWGGVDRNGNEVIPFISETGFIFSEGLARIMIDGKYGYINGSGEIVIPCEYDDAAEMFMEGLAWVNKNGKEGAIDKNGNFVIPMIYDGVSDFSCGRGFINENGIWTLITNPLDVKVKYADNYILFDQSPVIQDSRALVPLRAIFEAMNAQVQWDGTTQTVTAVKDDVTVNLQIGQNYITKNGENISLDVPAQLINDRTLVPVRAI